MPPRKRRCAPESSVDEDKFYGKKSRANNRKESQDAFSAKKCAIWFREYVSDKEEVIGPEGIERFCEDLGLAPDNVAMLVIAWLMDAKRMGYFTLQEWMKGFSYLQCDSMKKLQGKINALKDAMNEPDSFKSIYRYAYDFARDKDQRSMDTETAKCMLNVLLGNFWIYLPQFCQFLDQQNYKVVNRDQWANTFEFYKTVKEDLSNYDSDGAWPVMLDEFVEWLKVSKSVASA